ncbi:MAG: DinB family protein [Gemmatimonadaceae bacterium]
MPIERPNADEYAPYYRHYVDSVPEGDLLKLLEEQSDDVRAMAAIIGEARASAPYAPGKWSAKDVFLHIADTERVMAYRALRAARADATPLASFEQDDYVRVGAANRRPLADILSELQAVRAATIALFRGLDAEALARSGVASGKPVSPRALAFIIAGHERHHLRLLREQPGYLSGSPQASA